MTQVGDPLVPHGEQVPESVDPVAKRRVRGLRYGAGPGICPRSTHGPFGITRRFRTASPDRRKLPNASIRPETARLQGHEAPTSSALAGKVAPVTPDDPECYQWPVFSMDAQGCIGSRALPFCRSSMDTLSGDRTNAMCPSRGGRLMTTPFRSSMLHIAYMSSTS